MSRAEAPIAELPVGRDLRTLSSARVVADGSIVNVKEGLQRLGTFEALMDAIHLGVRQTLPREDARTVAELGVEKIHTVADVDRVTALRTRLETLLRPIADDTLRGFAAAMNPAEPRAYLGRHLGVRLMMPRPAVADRASDLVPGFMVPNRAHVDSWFNTSLNSVNLWIALGRVRPGNGMLMYPHLYRRPIARDGHAVAADQPLGEPVRLTLDPGDILVFSGDHIHLSETNTTDETRLVFTKRFSVGAPRYNPVGSGWLPYYDSRLLDGSARVLASARSRVTVAYGRHVLRTVLRRPPAYEVGTPAKVSA